MSEKLLIVDDTEMNRRLFRDVLEYHGYEVVEAADGAQGLEMAKIHNPVLVLLDIQMPVMDGFDTLAALRKDPFLKGVKVIALTSFAMRGDRERILAAGFDDYLSKPVAILELPGKVREWLKSREG
ncbi:response regulator [bacterium]|nr:MAG: response regulator [bacterium]